MTNNERDLFFSTYIAKGLPRTAKEWNKRNQENNGKRTSEQSAQVRNWRTK